MSYPSSRPDTDRPAHGGPSLGVHAVAETTLADVIELLFDTIRRPDGSRHSMDDAAQFCTAWLADKYGGPAFSKQHLAQLRAGDQPDPTIRRMEALAAFFDVDPVIFALRSERSHEIRESLALVREYADVIDGAGIQALAMRHGRITAGDRSKIIEHLRALPKKATGR